MKLKRKILSRVWLVRSFVFMGFLLVVISVVGIVYLLIKNSQFGYFINLGRIFANPRRADIKVIDDRVNLLILGKGDADHTAQDLTDSIFIVSIDIKNSKTYVTTLPRDIWVNGLKTKINSLYYYGNLKEAGGGLTLAKNVIAELIGVPIQYGVVIDFRNFEKIVDSVGGIDILIDKGFTDNKYPIAGRENDECEGDKTFACRYETIVFSQGLVHMDGPTALKYSRSRYSEDSEGNDFSRGGRQKQVLMSFKEKVFSKQYLVSPKKLFTLMTQINSGLERDFNDETGLAIARYLFESRDSFTSYDIPDNLYEIVTSNPEYDNLYVLLPKNREDLEKSVKCAFEMCD